MGMGLQLARVLAAGAATSLAMAAFGRGGPTLPSNVLVVDNTPFAPRGIPEDGRSWFTAFLTIQAAINTALSSGGQFDEIWVAAGDYRPTVSFNTTPAPDNTPVYSIEIRGGIQVYGGFAGNEQLRSQRDVGSNIVTIRPILPGDGRSGVTVRVYESGLLDGVRIRNVGDNQPDERKFNGMGVFGNAVVRDVSIDGSVQGDNTAIVLAAGNARLERVSISGVSSSASHAGLRINGNVRFLNGEISGINLNGSAGIEVVSGSPVIRRVLVQNCTSRTAAVRATPGTIFLNGIIRSNTNIAPNTIGTAGMVNGQLIGSEVSDNTATAGLAAVRNATVVNSTIVNNGARGVIGGSIDNSIVWGNGAGAEDNVLAGQFSGIANSLVRYSIIQGWTATPSTTIGSDPLFVADGDYRLTTGSPAIDAGSNSLVPRGLFTDADGRRRFAGSGTPSAGEGDAPRIERGAFEFESVPTIAVIDWCYADFDGSLTVDKGDLVAYMALFTLGHPLADVNADGVVNAADLTRFNELATAGCNFPPLP